MMEKFKNNKELAKKATAVAMAGMLAAGATGCQNISPSNPLSNIFGTQGEQTDGKHSDLLLNVLNDGYYNSIIAQASTSWENYKKISNSPLCDPHPYAFLEDEGIDTEKIKNGTYEAYSMSYVLDDEPNNLYIHTRVLIDDSYYQSYLITYKLSKQEMADYQAAHENIGKDDTYKWAANFLNDKISEMKEPSKVLEAKYDITTQTDIDKYSNSLKSRNIIVTDTNFNDKSFTIMFYNSINNKNAAMTKTPFRICEVVDANMDLTNGIYTIYNVATTGQDKNNIEKQATAFFMQEFNLNLGLTFTD